MLRAFIEPSDIEDQYEDDMDDDGPISYNNNDDWDGDIQVVRYLYCIQLQVFHSCNMFH